MILPPSAHSPKKKNNINTSPCKQKHPRHLFLANSLPLPSASFPFHHVGMDQAGFEKTDRLSFVLKRMLKQTRSSLRGWMCVSTSKRPKLSEIPESSAEALMGPTSLDKLRKQLLFVLTHPSHTAPNQPVKVQKVQQEHLRMFAALETKC